MKGYMLTLVTLFSWAIARPSLPRVPTRIQALAPARRSSHSRPPLFNALATDAGGKLYTVAQVARPSPELEGKLLDSIGQWYLRFNVLTMAASEVRPCSGSAPVWSASDNSTARTAPRAVSGPGNLGVFDIPSFYPAPSREEGLPRGRG